MEASVFDALIGGLKFDTKRFAKDINFFRSKSGHHASTSGAAANGAAQRQPPGDPTVVGGSLHSNAPQPQQQEQQPQEAGKKSKKKKNKRKRQDAEGQPAAAVDGIAVFGSAAMAAGGGVEEPGGVDTNTSSNPFRDAPEEVVRTGDPEEEANVIRKRHRIKVMADDGFREPTPIQRQAIPALLRGRELLAIAPTGSGKTLAFGLPMILYALGAVPSAGGSGSGSGSRSDDGDNDDDSGSSDDDDGGSPAAAAAAAAKGGVAANNKGKKDGSKAAQRGPAAVVVSPTRELSAQTHRLLARLTASTKLRRKVRLSLLSKPTAMGTDFSKVDVLTATPLLAERLVKSGRLALGGCRLLALDEADRLFEMGFVAQVDTVLGAATHPGVVRALFSATLPERVEEIARGVLRQPLRVTVGERNTAVSNVAQRLVFVGQEKGKLLALRQMVADGLTPPVLVFASSRERAQGLHRELLYEGVRVDSIHSDQHPTQRAAAVDNFRAGRTWVLVATDLVGRGMDFLGVRTVVNYDFPRSATDYIHRVGRTGRAGRGGAAITLFTEDDKPRVRAIANVMRAAGAEVPEWVFSLKKERTRKKRRAGSGVDLLEEEEGGDDGGGAVGNGGGGNPASAAGSKHAAKAGPGGKPGKGAGLPAKSVPRGGAKQQQQRRRLRLQQGGAPPGAARSKKAKTANGSS